MLKVSDVREMFSKGSVVIGNDTICAMYNFKDRWFAQSISNKYKQKFYELLNLTDGIEIDIFPKKYIQFIFKGDFGIKGRAFFLPVDSEITKDELEKILNEKEITDPHGILESYKKADLTDQEVLREIANKIFDKAIECDQRSTSLNSMKRWSELEAVARGMANSSYIVTIDSDMRYVEIEFESSLRNRLIIEHINVDKISRLVYCSDDIGIEGNVMEGIVDIDFYV